MTVCEVMKEEREAQGMTQRQFAAELHVSYDTARAYEDGRRQMPTDVAARAVRVLKSPRLQAQLCFECPINLFTMPYLDRVDQHPMTVQAKVAQELEEAATALRQLDLANKLEEKQLAPEDRKALDLASEQLADLFAALHTVFAVWSQRYGIDPDSVAMCTYRKLMDKGYCTPQTAPEVPELGRAA